MSEAKQAEAPGKGARWKGLVGGLVLLLVGGGAGFGGAMALGGGGDHAPADASGHGEAGGHAEGGQGAAAGGHGGGGHGVPLLRGASRSVVNLGTFTVNLRGSGGGRILRAEVQVEVDGADQAAVEARRAVLRDAVITLASDFTFADLEGVDGKTHLRDELLGRLNSVTERSPEVGRVYFTEFVVQ